MTNTRICIHQFVPEIDGSIHCKDCPRVWIPKEPEGKPECPQCKSWKCGELYNRKSCGCSCHGGAIPMPKETGGEIRTPFDGEPVKGRVFTKEEVKERLKMFQQLFNL